MCVNRYNILFLFAISFLLCGKVWSNPSKEVKVCWENGLKAPYLLLKTDSNGKLLDPRIPVGIAVDLIDEIFKKSEFKVTHILMPWVRCLSSLQSGEVDLVPNASITSERKEYAYFSTESLYKTHLVLFYNKSNFKKPPKIATLDELKKYRVGGVHGFNYNYFEDKIKVDMGASNREQLMHKLLENRFDFAIEQEEIIKYIWKQGLVDLKNVKSIPNPSVKNIEFFVMIAKKSKDAIRIKKTLDLGIAKVKSNGFQMNTMKSYLK
jgi:polar amino acid transport system substrate-binding protein